MIVNLSFSALLLRVHLSLTKHGYLVSSRTLSSTLFRLFTPDTSSILQGGYQHPLSRSWQARRHLTKSMFMYPIFITDDPNASVVIPSLPGQRRWGVNKLEEFLGPLVKKGLESVILFGVPFNCKKVRNLIVQMQLGVLMAMTGHERISRRRPNRPRHPCYQKTPRALSLIIHQLRRLPLRIHRPRALRSSPRRRHY